MTARSTAHESAWSSAQVELARFLLAGLQEEASRAEHALARGDLGAVDEAVTIGTRLLLRLEGLHDAARAARGRCRDAGTVMLLGAVHGMRLREAGLRASAAFAVQPAAAAV